ncbi:MarR family transcriptional regulator [Haloarcula salina]|uniref:MarR family winged helix-turn-helix transcriptional regulator n=1 Tax=Haloarcula salina TaxID=1429914 RepID=A0AA41KHM2_9EURY|nr:MarR family winged helix-turn-helix transcriptional regulator [Haloarcula salina]MBV0900743.1 MarR family winged helix-turn-helix transcriptional regulator [Haloarcula salina]
MRHKQILDVAADNPEASIEDLAAEVPSATPDLVERVLEKHGDPASEDDVVDTDAANHVPSADDDIVDTDAADRTPSADDDPTATMDTDTSAPTTEDGATAPVTNQTDSPSYPAPADLSPTQRETLRAITEHPTASQRDLAEVLDVTASTISNRVNSIDGFDWSERESFAHAVLDGEEPTAAGPSTTDSRQSSPEVVDTVETVQSTVDQLSTQIEDLEGRMETVTDGSGATQAQARVFDDPELVHKVVHACMDSENISEDEELRILKSLL